MAVFREIGECAMFSRPGNFRGKGKTIAFRLWQVTA
jgi:hypothetical protein